MALTIPKLSALKNTAAATAPAAADESTEKEQVAPEKSAQAQPAQTKAEPTATEKLEAAAAEVSEELEETFEEEVADEEVQLPATTSGGALAVHQERGDGFDGLEQEVGYGSYPTIVLDKGEFQSSDGAEFKELDVVFIRNRFKYLIKARRGEMSEKIPFVYSYDKETDVKGNSIKDLIAEWRELGEMKPGAAPEISQYAEVQAFVFQEDSPLHGELVLLNVAPASIRRLAGYREKLAMRGWKLQDVVTRLSAGPKISKGDTTFRPWDFKMVALAQKQA